MIVASPAPVAVPSPLLSTLASEVLLEVHEIVAVSDAGVTLAVSCVVPLRYKRCDVELRVTTTPYEKFVNVFQPVAFLY